MVYCLNPLNVQFISLHLSGQLRCCSSPVQAPYIPMSNHKSLLGRDDGVGRTLGFPRGLAHRQHNAVASPQVAAWIVDCRVVRGLFNILSFYRSKRVNLLPNPLPGGQGLLQSPLTRNCSQAEGLFLTLGPKWGTRSLSKVIIRRPLHEGLFDSKHLYMKYLSIICSLKFSLKREWSFSWKRKLDWISSNTTCSWWSWQIPRKIVLHNKCCSTLPCFYRDEISINRRHNEYQLHLEKQYFNRRRIHRKEKDGDRYIDL